MARDAEVISPLGVALALVRDVVERTIVAPTPADVVRVRREAFERVVAAGAAPDLVDVTVEIDTRRNLVRAIASGATANARQAVVTEEATDRDKTVAAARALRVTPGAIAEEARAGTFACYRVCGKRTDDTCLVDSRGVVRLVARRARVSTTTVGRSQRVLAALIDEMTAFGDVGRALPELHLAYGTHLADLGTLAEVEHVLALAAEELRGLADEAPVAIIAARRDA